MDISTIIGLLIGLGLVGYGMSDPETMVPPMTFFNAQGMAIVIGGTFAATLINYPLPRILGIFKVAMQAFMQKEKSSAIEIIEESLRKTAEKNLLPMQPGDVPATYANIDDLVRDVGFRPETPLEVGIPRFVSWYRDYFQV